jgi:hypothetical protein
MELLHLCELSVLIRGGPWLGFTSLRTLRLGAREKDRSRAEAQSIERDNCEYRNSRLNKLLPSAAQRLRAKRKRHRSRKERAVRSQALLRLPSVRRRIETGETEGGHNRGKDEASNKAEVEQ